MICFSTSSAALSLTSIAGSGTNPCRDCVRLGKECVYPPLRPRRRRAKGRRTSDNVEDPLARMEARLHHARISGVRHGSQSPLPMYTETHRWQGDNSSYTALEDEYEARYATTDTAQNPDLQCRLSNSPVPGSRDAASGLILAVGGQGERVARERSLSSNFSASDGVLNGENDSQHEPHEINRDHQESWSLTAVFSQEGLKWVSTITRTRDLIGIAERFARSNTRLLLSNPYRSLSSKSLETDEVTAWDYVNGECSKIRLNPRFLLNISVVSLL